MSKKIYIYTKNHNNTKGIQIHINFIKKIFKKYEIILTKKINKNSKVIFIENFTNNDAENIAYYKVNKNIKVILVLTEFINEKSKIFNCFELNKSFYKFIPFQLFTGINIFLFLNLFIFVLFFFLNIDYVKHIFLFVNIYFFLNKFSRYKIFKNTYYRSKTKLYKYIILTFNFDIKKTPLYNFLKFLEFTFFYSINAVLRNIKNLFFFKKLVIFQYFKERYLNSEKVIKNSDLILVTHPKIYNQNKKKNNNIYYLFPEIKKFKPNLLKDKKKIFKFSGEYSFYRRNYFKKMFLKIKKSQIKNFEITKYLKYFETNLKKYRIGQFIDIKRNQKYTYSFHPKKNNIWYYSSPIRYLEAIDKGEIPIVTDNFHDFFTKNLSINIKNLFNDNKNFSKNYQINVNLINKKLNVYNKFQKINELKIKKLIL